MAARDPADASPGSNAQPVLAHGENVVLTARRMKPAGATKHGTEHYLIASNKQNCDRGRNRQNLPQPRFRSFLPHVCTFCSHLFGRSSFGFADLRICGFAALGVREFALNRRNSFRQFSDQCPKRISKILQRRIIALSWHHDQIVTLRKIVLQVPKGLANSATFQIAMNGRPVLPRNTQAEPSDIQIVGRRKNKQMLIAGALPNCINPFEVLRNSQMHGLRTSIAWSVHGGVKLNRVWRYG